MRNSPGRVSSAAKAVANLVSINTKTRPEPPERFDEAHAAVFREVIAPFPVDWWNASNLPLLEEYVSAIVLARYIDERINQILNADEVNPMKLNHFTIMKGRVTKDMKALATSMRLTQASTYDRTKKNQINGGPEKKKPWQV